MAKMTQTATPQVKQEQQPQDMYDFLVSSVEAITNHAKNVRGDPTMQAAMQAALQAAMSQLFGGGGGFIMPSTTSQQTAKPAAPTPQAAPPPKNRPAGATPPPPAKAATTKPVAQDEADEEDDNNSKSLIQVVWDVLDRDENAEGLKISDIIKVIKDEDLWRSPTGAEIDNQVSGMVYKLKEQNKLVRGDNKVYYIPQGATPPEPKKRGRPPASETADKEPAEANA